MISNSLNSMLLVVAAHPWIDAEQASALAGLSHRQADRLLDQAVREGLAQACHVFGLCTHGASYALKPYALREGFTGSPIGLERALLRIESLWGARNLLAHLTKSETLTQAGSPDRLLVPVGHKFGKIPNYLDVLAWGTVKRGTGLLPFVIEWDLGEVVPEAYRHRFATIYRIVQQCDLSTFPVWVMVTTNRQRAAQLLWLWRHETARHHARPLRFYVAEWSAVVSGRPDVWQRIGNEGTPLSLFHGESGQADVALKPYRAGRPPRQSFSADRVLAGQSDRHQLARAHLSVPDRFARRVLRCIANWPLLSASETALLLSDERETNVRPALRGLARLGLLAEYRRPQEPARFYLTALGVQLLAAASGMEPSLYVRYRRWPAKFRQGRRRKSGGSDRATTRKRGRELDVGILVRHLQHTRDVRAFMVSLAGAARHYRSLRFDHALMVWDESECRRYYRVSGEPRALIPDSGGVYRIGRDSFEFLLEIDRGTMSRRKLARKFDSYYSFRQTGEYLRGGTRLPQLLVIVPDEGRAHVIRQVILERARLAGLTPLDAWIAVQDTLDARGPAALVWRHVADWKMRCCFPGFENADQLPRPLSLAQLSREVTRDMKRVKTIRERRTRTGRP